MKHKVLVSLVSVSILAVGLLIWNCGDGGRKDEVKPQLKIELTADKETISADDSFAGDTVTITAKVTKNVSVQAGKEVSFAVTTRPTGSLASVGPATNVTDTNGEAITTLSAGTVAGEVVVKGTVDNKSDEVTITVTAPTLAGIAAIGGIEQYICSDSRALTVQLIDVFGNEVKESGKEVTFSATTGTISPVSVFTDSDGRATSVLIAPGLTIDDSVIVTATLTFNGSTVSFTLTRVAVPHLACFFGEPSFRLNTLVIDGDTTNNEFGKMASDLNLLLQNVFDDGNINLIFVLKNLTEENRVGPTTVIWASLSGLCGAPAGPATISCTGTEVEFFIDPASYDSVTGEVKTWADGNITDGNLSVISSGITMPVIPYYDIILELPICDVDIAGTVNAQLTEIAGSMIEETYCPDGCGTIAGVITKEDFCDLIDSIMPGFCEIIIFEYGLTTDTDCAGEPAFSVRMLYAGTSVTLYEVP